MMRIEGQLAFTKPHLFGQIFIFYQEPVMDQTKTNLQQNTISLNLLDFNRILFLSKLSYLFDDALLITRDTK